jgi:hypothetical protein
MNFRDAEELLGRAGGWRNRERGHDPVGEIAQFDRIAIR